MSFKEISSIFLHFGAESNIGTSILPRRKVKKMPKELEAQANKPIIQVYTESDSKIGMWEGGALNLCQAQPVLKQLNLKSLAMEAGHKFSGCPTSPEPIFESRAV